MKNKLLIFIPLTLAIIGLAWWGLTSSPSQLITPDLIGSGPEQQLLDSLASLKSVDLSGDIFKDAIFGDLKDFSTTIVPDPIGRQNPFGPLQGQAIVAPTTTAHAVPASEAKRLFSNPRKKSE